MLARIAIIAITTSSSISVKPIGFRLKFVVRVAKFVFMSGSMSTLAAGQNVAARLAALFVIRGG